MQSSEIRSRFLDYFVSRGHSLVPSASLISQDPTVLFTVAGMQPFKPYFLGQIQAPWTTATTSQKVVRTLDIDEVGRTARHNTFFEMLGNFSFGDYFKQRAIPLAWQLLTGPVEEGCFGLDPERLWVTVYEADDEAFDIWTKEVGFPAERIQRLGMDDNYWSMGVPGPCGPDSEIFWDRGPDYGAGGGPSANDARYLEIWNLVFMQSERGESVGGEFPILRPLPKPNIDTGMGLERLAIILQGAENIFETDLMVPTLRRAEELSGAKYLAGDKAADVRLRIVADHTRTATMLIGDGVTPGNEGRGYVLRRLLRRAVRSMRLLGASEPVMASLVAVVRDSMGSAYPELVTDFARIEQVAVTEELAFRSTLDKGTALFSNYITSLEASGADTVPGDIIFKLHDTFGFPFDLTREMAEELGYEIDTAGFESAMAEQKARARADRSDRKIGNTDVSAYGDLLRDGATPFLGYDELSVSATVRTLLREGIMAPAASEGDVVEVVLDRTPFYAESGGQDSDAGIISGEGFSLEVLKVARPVKGLIVHRVRVTSGEVVAGAPALAAVDPQWRLGACQAHSGTHIVHAALRQVLGPSALQSGSYNRPGYLRLDFAWPGALSPETRSEIEEVANIALRMDLPVSAILTSLASARELGAVALFGETYDEVVRVVEIGGPWSRELCGGTHVARSSQVGTVVVTGESSVGSGVRRVEALVGIEGFQALARDRSRLAALAAELKSPADDVVGRVGALQIRVRELERELSGLRSAALTAGAGALAASPADVFGVAFVGHEAPAGTPGDAVRTLALDIRGRMPADRPAVVAVGAAGDGKASLVVAINDAARAAGHKAGELVLTGSQVLGGRGGGKDDVAQGGGPAADRLVDALTAVEHFVGARATGSA